MTNLPTDWLALVSVVFLLGCKHGMDPDHLATIDGLTRYNAGIRPRVSRWAGCLFSLGHGLVVTLIALLVATVAQNWAAPAWLQHFGTWVSMAFLVTLGGVNLQSAIRAPAGTVVPVGGLRTRLLGPLAQASHPVVIAAVGAAFALSFDTISQAALFSVTGSRIAGWSFAVMLGGVFTLGMMVTDTINGVWVSRLVGRADLRGAAASRAMSLAVGAVSIVIAAATLARWWSPEVDEFVEALGLWAGASVVAAMLLSYLAVVCTDRRAQVAGRRPAGCAH